jgi:hypothetical protein
MKDVPRHDPACMISQHIFISVCENDDIVFCRCTHSQSFNVEMLNQVDGCFLLSLPKTRRRIFSFAIRVLIAVLAGVPPEHEECPRLADHVPYPPDRHILAVPVY